MEIKNRYDIQYDEKLLNDIDQQKEKSKQSGRQVAELIMGFINGGFTAEFFEGFFDVILNEHRTLQQLFQKFLILKWVRMQSHKTEGFFDLRNQYTVEQCKIMQESLEKAEKHYEPPFI